MIIIRGPSSVGKSSVSRRLAEILPMGAHIDVDRTVWYSTQTWEKLGMGYFGDHGFIKALAAECLRLGLTPIFEQMFEDEDALETLVADLEAEHGAVHVFNLTINDESQHLARDSDRPAAEEPIGPDGVRYFAEKKAWDSPSIGTVIDTTGKSVSDVAEEIIIHIKNRNNSNL